MFILICWLLINVGHKIPWAKQTLWLNIVDCTGGNTCKNTFWMSVVVTPAARFCKCEVHTNFSAVLLICSRGPGEIISQTLHGKFFFPSSLLTAMQNTASYFGLRKMWALPHSLGPDEILSAVNSSFLCKTGRPDHSDRSQVASSEDQRCVPTMVYLICDKNIVQSFLE